MNVGTLVSSQEQRALFVPLINRGQTANEPVVNRRFCSSGGFQYELDCSFFRTNLQDSVLDTLEGEREGCLLAGSTQRHPVVPLRPAALLCAAPTRPARGVSVFWIRQVYIGIPSFVLAQGCADVYQACRSIVVRVCIHSASRNEECLLCPAAHVPPRPDPPSSALPCVAPPHPALSRPSAPRPAPPRPAWWMSVFRNRQVV